MPSHWPCVTDNSGITTYGLMALEWEISTPTIPSRSVAQFTSGDMFCGTDAPPDTHHQKYTTHWASAFLHQLQLLIGKGRHSLLYWLFRRQNTVLMAISR